MNRTVKWIKVPVFLLCLGPLANLAWLTYQQVRGLGDGLGANPLEYITHSTGFWTLTFLCITLAITPLRKVLHQNWLVRFRRMMGLFAFSYAFLHFMTWLWFDRDFNVSAMLDDFVKRRFITAGLFALVMMLPLALTSTQGMIRRLGGRRWQALHRLIYLSAIAGVIHYIWLVKSDETIPFRFAAVVGILLAYRLIVYVIEKRGRATPARRDAKQPAIPA